MLPTSHSIQSLPLPEGFENGRELLSTAFEGFLVAAGEVERSYQTLQKEVSRLRGELEDRNQALSISLAETEQVRRALHDILQTLPCGVVVAESNQNRIVLLNPEARRCLGLDKDSQVTEVPGKLCSLPVSSSLEAVEAHEIIVQQPEETLRIEVIRRARKIDQSQAEVIFILRDVTRQRELEEEKERARHFVALSEVSSVLAHEIRNPLAMLELFSSLLAEVHTPGTEPHAWTQHLQAGIRSLGCTVNNVLRVSIHSTPAKSHVQLGQFLEAAVDFVRPMADQAGIEIQLEVLSGRLALEADATGLHQVFLNLANNAFKHMPKGGCFRIVSSVTAGHVLLEFSDTGSGIEPENLPSIFKRGFSTGAGAGLGLPVCERIVSEHGGTIRVQSVVGIGTKFSVELPIQ